MLAFDPDLIAQKRRLSTFAKSAGLGLSLGTLGMCFLAMEVEPPATRMALYFLAGGLLLAVAGFSAWAYAIDRKFAPLKDSLVRAQLTLVRRSSAELDRELYALERHKRDLCRGEAALMLAHYNKST